MSTLAAIDPFVIRQAEIRASRMIGNYGFTRDDWEDLRQELLLDYVERRPRFSPERGDHRGFAFGVLRNRAAKLAARECLFLISHAKEIEVDTRTGKYTRVVPTLPDKARKIVLGMVDQVLFCDLDLTTGDDGAKSIRRVIRTKPSLYYEAGDRTGRLPETIDLDFPMFLDAFNTAVAPLKPAKAAKTTPAKVSSQQETNHE
ncbi:MAG: ATP-binding protein [Acidobacteriia bacterium]|nr:ATP-binding protein [Terriglobia bacterium]